MQTGSVTLHPSAPAGAGRGLCGKCNSCADPVRLRKRIGSTVYEVHVHFNQDAKETMNDKILRLVRNDLNAAPQDVILAMPRMNRLPERGSI